MKQNDTHIEAPAVGCLIGQAYQKLLGELSAALKDAGLDITNNEYLILRALYSEDGLQQCQIAESTGKDKALICRCVTAMAAKGYVRVEPVSHKCLRIWLTESARRAEAKVMEVARARHKALTSLCSGQEFECFVTVLNKILTN